jgi:hypothetical protein
MRGSGNARVGYVFGNWIIPSFSIPRGVSGFYEFTMSSWVGIEDGPGIVQAGTAQVIEPNNFAGILWGDSSATFPWVEWFPEDMKVVANMPAAPGDEFSVEIGLTSQNTAFVWMVNVSQGAEAFMPLQEAPGGIVNGEQAEWVVENYEVLGADPLYLPEFASVIFFDCGGLMRLPMTPPKRPLKSRLQSFDLATPGIDWINMVSPSGNIMATPVSLGPTAMMVNYVSP